MCGFIRLTILSAGLKHCTYIILTTYECRKVQELAKLSVLTLRAKQIRFNNFSGVTCNIGD